MKVSSPPPLECPICLEDLPNNNSKCATIKDKDGKEATIKAVTLVCQHVFHEACIGSWIALKGSCPMCRSAVSNLGLEENYSHSLGFRITTIFLCIYPILFIPLALPFDLPNFKVHFLYGLCAAFPFACLSSIYYVCRSHMNGYPTR